MNLFSNKYFLISVLFFLSVYQSFGQFYNGHQMTFGKNRVQYNDFYWSYYRFEKFDTYFNEYGKNIAEFAGRFAFKKINEIENFFDYSLEKRIIFIIYNKLSDFRQSNIGLLTGVEEYNTGGTTKIINNKVFLFFKGDHIKFEQQITAAITEALINEMLYGNKVKDRIANSTLINLPDWYLNGLISYVSNNWDIEIENHVKDGILNGKYEKFNRLIGQDAIYAGHSFWRFIAKIYGESTIPNILYLTRINKNANSGFLYVLGTSIKDLSYEWLGYYISQYSETADNRSLPESGKIIKNPKARMVYQKIKISPNGKYIAYLTNESGQYKIWLYNSETKKHKKILKKEHKIDQIIDYSYPVLAWHPTGKYLTFISEEEGGLKLSYYTLSTGEIVTINLLYFEKILDFSFSHDGLLFVFSAIKEGQTDIFVHNIASSTNEQITRDIADDFHPRFINNSEQIIFSSNRLNETISFEKEDNKNTGLTHNLFIYDYKNKSNTLTKLSDEKYINKLFPLEIKNNMYVFLSDKNGIINRYVAEFDSTISFIDTTIHYRYFTKTYPHTNYSRNINVHDFSKKTGMYGEIIYSDGKYHIYYDQLNTNQNSFSGEINNTEFRNSLTKDLIEIDSLNIIYAEAMAIEEFKEEDSTLTIQPIDSSFQDFYTIDINNYIFEQEKINYVNRMLFRDNLWYYTDTSKFRIPPIRIYETSFYTNNIVNQIDFGFLNASYQAFTGGAVYYNPGLNMLFKIGVNDLFEDYKIVGGLRFSGDFDSNEYLLSFENLKTRLDKQIIFHRQTFKSKSDYFIVKTHTHELMYILSYPFSQVTALKGTASFRHDKNVFLATDMSNLNTDDIIKAWGGLKLEYIFDNTRSLGLNLYYGTRFKLFAETYRQINKKKSNLFVLGVDFRHYQKIHRNFILASRFAASTSFGKSRLLYYLGSVDNWTNLSSKVETFDKSVPINDRENYAYQTLATNMRGFTQNIRNGNNFALINNEIRLPIISYLVNHPIGSSFLSNFQIVGFADIGTAWTGLTPYSGKNAYDIEIIESGPITVTLDSNREPIVAGFGFGLRTVILGYFVRTDWAWGIENNILLPRILYLSLVLDF